VDEFFIAFDDGVGALFEGELDGDAEAGGLARTFVTSGHNASARARDAHESGVGEQFSEFGRQDVVGVGRGGTRGAKDGDLAAVAVGLENFESVAEFLEGAVHQLHLPAPGLILGEFDHRLKHVGGKFFVFGDARFIEKGH
jgi:hypothetical protein